MPLSDIVTVNITTEGPQVTRAGFGTALILAADTPVDFTERVRTYSNMTAITEDFAADTGTYLMASRHFSQNPKPVSVMVGRLALKPTQRWAVTPVASNSTVYSMKVNGTTVSYTSDASATVTEIIAGLKTEIDALSLAITVSDQTTYMRIVANTAGDFFSIESLDITLLGVAQDHADPGYATDLDAIALENSTWYAILNPFNSAASVAAIAGWAESNEKLFIAQTQDSAVATIASGSDTSSIAYTLKNSAYVRTTLHYHPQTSAFLDGGLAGACLPLDPGSETWMFKTLAGVPAVNMTDTQATNVLTKNCGTYQTIAGVNITREGKVSSGTYVDIVRGRDWLRATMSEDIFAYLAGANKVPFTDRGIAGIEGKVRARLRIAVDQGLLSDNPAPTVTVPLAADVSAADKAARTLNNVTFDAVLAGAIHKVTINGVVTV